MGQFTYVYGFIHSTPGESEYNISVLQKYPFDDQWPLPNIFACPQPNRTIEIFSFGMAFRSGDDDIGIWQPAFERLLAHLRVDRARVDWQEDEIDTFSYHYFCMERDMWHEWIEREERTWSKIVTDRRGAPVKEHSIDIILSKSPKA